LISLYPIIRAQCGRAAFNWEVLLLCSSAGTKPYEIRLCTPDAAKVISCPRTTGTVRAEKKSLGCSLATNSRVATPQTFFFLASTSNCACTVRERFRAGQPLASVGSFPALVLIPTTFTRTSTQLPLPRLTTSVPTLIPTDTFPLHEVLDQRPRVPS